LSKEITKVLIVTIVLFTPSLIFAKSPLLQGTWEEIVQLTDEFEGADLDSTKWNNIDPKWVGRHPSYFEPSNISVLNGELHLTSREINSQDSLLPEIEKGKYTHAAAAVKSKVKVKYGYFEIKAKAGNSKFWSSFWFYDHAPESWSEIDVFEVVGIESYLVRTAHHFRSSTFKGTDKDHLRIQREDYDFNSTDYHIYGLNWNKDNVTWYVDGEEVFTTPNYHWHQALYMIFDTEVNLVWPKIPESNTLPSDFKIDSVRSWKRKDECEATTILKNKQWKLLTLPCDPAGKTVEELFGQESFGGSYLKNWLVYEFDPLLIEYKKVALTDQVEAGKGYWFIQLSGKDIEYTMTGAALSKYQRIDVESKGAAPIWNMIGNPYPHGIQSKDTRWYSEISKSTMTWSEANSQNLVHTSVFTYEDGEYVKKDMSDLETRIAPWSVYWVAILENYSDSPVYLSGDGIDWGKFK